MVTINSKHILIVMAYLHLSKDKHVTIKWSKPEMETLPFPPLYPIINSSTIKVFTYFYRCVIYAINISKAFEYDFTFE